MARFDLMDSLSTGLFSGLSREPRLYLAHIAARLPSAGERGHAFLALSGRLSDLEADFAHSLSSQVTGRFHSDLERHYDATLLKPLFAPSPPGDAARDGTLSPPDSEGQLSRRLFKRPESSGGPEASVTETDGAEELYQYYFASTKDQDPENIRPRIVNDSIQRTMELSAASAPSVLGISVEKEPDNDAQRKRKAYEAFAVAMTPVLRRLDNDREAARQGALDRIRQLSNECLQRIEAAPSSRDLTASDNLSELLVGRSRERIAEMTERSLDEIRRTADLFDHKKVVASILSRRLQQIDKDFGEPYRKAFRSLIAKHQDWADVRNALDKDGEVRFIDLSPNLRRGELRRELIAASVRCAIDNFGLKFVRHSAGEASGPPPYFMNWIRREEIETARIDKENRAKAVDQSLKVTR